MLLSASGLIKCSFSLYRDNRQLFLKYMVYLFIPSGAALLISSIAGAYLKSYGDRPPFVPTAVFGTLIGVTSIAASVISLWVSIAFIRSLADRAQGLSAKNPKEEIQISKGMVLPALVASILNGLVVLAGFILLIIPGIIFSIWYAFTVYGVALDNHRGMEALRASKALVKGRFAAVFWRLFAPGFVFGAILFVAQGAIEAPFQLLANSGGANTVVSTTIVILGSLLGTAAGLLVTPLATAAPTLLYLDLRKTRSVSSTPLPEQTPTI